MFIAAHRLLSETLYLALTESSSFSSFKTILNYLGTATTSNMPPTTSAYEATAILRLTNMWIIIILIIIVIIIQSSLTML